jgi:predicted enzyme related to lactoylglutathione lyase
VDATTQQAESLGATVLRAPTDVPGLCRFAILRDPQGAVFGAYAAQHPIGPLGNTPVGGFSWHELATADGSAAWDFYAALFGWRKTDAMEMGPIGKYQMFGVNEQSLGGIYTLPRDLDIASHWLPYTQVEDSRRAGAAVEAGGGRVVSAPMQVPSGAWVAKLVDPQGVVFAVHSRQVSPVAEAAAPASGKSPTSRSTKPAPKRVTTRSVPRAHSKPAAKKAGGARSSARKSAKAPRAKRAASTRSRATTRARAAGAAKPARRPAAKAAAKKRKRA